MGTSELRVTPTPKQAAILRWMVGYFAEHAVWPSIRDIAGAFGITSPNGVVCHLLALRSKGWLLWERGRDGAEVTARSYRVAGLDDVLKRAAAEYLKTLGA